MGTIQKIIDEVAEEKPDAQIWMTFFGEGLILKDLPERIRYAKNRGLTRIDLNSNGTLLHHDNAERLILAGLNRLLVGIDAFYPETYAKNRVGGDLEKTVAGVLEYNQLLKKIGAEGQSVCVQFIEMDNNRDEKQQFVDFWSAHGIPVKVRPMVSWGGKVNAPNLEKDLQRLPCYWAINTLVVTYTGQVALCATDLECDMPMGDIKEQTLREVWNDKLLKLRNFHREGQWDRLPDMCKNCMDWQSGYADYKTPAQE